MNPEILNATTQLLPTDMNVGIMPPSDTTAPADLAFPHLIVISMMLIALFSTVFFAHILLPTIRRIWQNQIEREGDDPLRNPYDLRS